MAGIHIFIQLTVRRCDSAVKEYMAGIHIFIQLTVRRCDSAVKEYMAGIHIFIQLTVVVTISIASYECNQLHNMPKIQIHLYYQ